MTEAEIDRLSIEISADSGAASANLEKLAASLRSLEGGLGSSTAKLRSVSQALRELKSASGGIDSGTLAALQGLSTLKVSVTLGKNIGSLANALKAFPEGGAARIRELASALAPLSGVKVGAASLKGLTQLPEVVKSWAALDVDAFVRQIKALNSQLPSLAANLKRVSDVYRTLPVSMRGAGRAARSAAQSNQLLATSANEAAAAETRKIGLFNKGAGILSRFNIGMAAITGAAYALKRGFEATIGEVNTYIENMNLFSVSMGEYANAATEYGQKVQDALGIDFGEWARNQGVFMTLATGMGETAERANVMSQQLTQLGYDIASFYNISVDDAMLKLQSGLSGELEPLRRLGWDLSQARMQIEATNLGIEKNVSEMTQAEKVALRYRLIMRQVTQTHGDMARTIASPANQLRVLQAQLALAARAIGQLFIPALNRILPVVIAVVKAIRMLAQELANFFGIDIDFDVDYSGVDMSGMSSGVEDTSDAIEDVGDQAEDSKKKVDKLKNSVMGFDELNKLTGNNDEDDELEDALDDLGGLMDDLPLDTYDFLDGLEDKIGKLTDDLAKKLADAFKKLLPIIAGIGAAIAAWKLAPKIMKAIEALKKLLAALRGGEVAKAIQAVDKALDAGKVAKAAEAAKALSTVAKAAGAAKAGKAFGLLGEGSKALKGAKVAGLLNGAVEAGGKASKAGKAGEAAKAVSTIDGVRKSVESLGKVARGVREVFAGIVSKIGELIPKSGPVANVFKGAAGFARLLSSNVFLAVSRVVELTIESAAFRKGLESIAGIIGKLFDAIGKAVDWAKGALGDLGSAISGIAPGLDPVFDAIGGAVDALNLDFTDLLFTVGGFALLATPAAPLGLFLLGLEGVTLAVRALGAATEDCVVKMDPLEGVSDDVREALGTAMDSAYDFEEALKEIDYGNAAPTQEQIDRIANDTADIANTVLNNLDSKRNSELASIDMLAGAEGVTAETLERMRGFINEKYDSIGADTQAAKDRINAIIGQAAAEGRDLTDAELSEIRTLYQTMYANLLATSGAGEADLALIDNNIKNNRERAALEAAETVIAKAQETRDETIRAAEDQYNQIVQTAGQMRDAGQITDEEYQNIINSAAQAKDKTVSDAESQYSQILSKTESSLGDLSSKFDFTEGRIKENWEIWLGDIKNALDGALSGVMNAWSSFATNIQSAFDSTVSNIRNAFDGTLGPNGSVTNGLRDLGNAFWGTVDNIKSAIGGLADWMRANVVDPILNMFSNLRIDIPLPHIEWDWQPVNGPFGSFSVPWNFQVRWYARGGFPEMGQLFMAREAGPELVGTMGNKNAVANNMQIVQGIEAGVTSAMLQVLPAFTYQQQSGGGDVNMVLMVDGQELARATERGQAERVRRGEASVELGFF